MSNSDECGSMVYQGVQIVHYDRSLTSLKNKQESEYAGVIQRLVERVKVHSTDLLTYAITVMATHGWEKSTNTVKHWIVSLPGFLYHWRILVLPVLI